MWVARDENGGLHLWVKKPVRHISTLSEYPEDYKEEWGIMSFWTNEIGEIAEEGALFGDLPNDLFPELTWGNEPVEVELVPVNRRVCDSCGHSYIYHDSDIIDESEPEKENFWIYTECPECGYPNSL